MSDILSTISDNLIQILSTIITGIIGYLGLRIKNIYQEYIQDKIKKEIVDDEEYDYDNNDDIDDYEIFYFSSSLMRCHLFWTLLFYFYSSKKVWAICLYW